MVFYSGLNFLSTEEFRLFTSVATLAKFIIDIYVALIFFILINFWFGFGFGFIKCFYNVINFIALLWCDCALGQFVQWCNQV